MHGKETGEAILWNYFTNTFSSNFQHSLKKDGTPPVCSPERAKAGSLLVCWTLEDPGHHSPTHRSTGDRRSLSGRKFVGLRLGHHLQQVFSPVGHGNVYRLVDRTLVLEQRGEYFQESSKDPSESVFCMEKSQERQAFGTISQHKSCCGTDEGKFQRPV